MLEQQLSPIDALLQGGNSIGQIPYESNEDSRMPLRRVIRIGDYHLLYGDDMMGEILDPPPVLHCVPHGEPWFCGMINVRGNIVPVFDLHTLLAVTPNEHVRSYMFCCGKGDAMAAWKIDGLPEQHRLHNDGSVLNDDVLPESSLSALIRAAWLSAGRLCIDLDFEQLFTTLAQKD